jgi:hypothetical protein
MSWACDANGRGGQPFRNISFFIFESSRGVSVAEVGFETCHSLFEGWGGRIGPSSYN